jgi:hypothetical protein
MYTGQGNKEQVSEDLEYCFLTYLLITHLLMLILRKSGHIIYGYKIWTLTKYPVVMQSCAKKANVMYTGQGNKEQIFQDLKLLIYYSFTYAYTYEINSHNS